MKESDWKLFKQIKERAVERFCEVALAEFAEAIADKHNHPYNRYTLLVRLAENRDKQMALIFDGHSRNNAPLQLFGMRLEGLADVALLQQLSPELQQQTDPARKR